MRKINYKYTITILFILVNVFIVFHGCNANSEEAYTIISQGNEVVIYSLNIPRQLGPSQGVDIQCIAIDKTSSILNYTWAVSDGEIKGKGDTVKWFTPAKSGTHLIKVSVTNAKGDKASLSANVIITDEPSPYPIIEKVLCVDCRNGNEASRYSGYRLKCETSNLNQDQLSYRWIPATGRITGEGNNVSWETTGQHGNTLIKVIVSDGKGHETEGYLSINISCCK